MNGETPFNPEMVAPATGELKKITDYEITPEILSNKGETFYLGSKARITIVRDKESPTGLSVYSPFTESRYTNLSFGLNTVGRDPKSDIIINDMTVSRNHLGITVGEKQINVSDLSSTNGTMIEL